MGMKITWLITLVIFLSVSLILPLIPACSALEVSCRAIKARESDEYSPNTAWDLGYTAKGIVIAVIDTGVDDGDHESLKNKFIAGVDFTKPFGPITNPDDGSVNPDDDSGHGTLVASIAMGTGGPTHKYEGVAPDAKLVDVKRGDLVITERCKDALEWCITHKDADWDDNGPSMYDGIDVITITAVAGSSGETNSDGQDTWSQLVNEAVESGIVVVCAAGNYGPDNDGLDAPVSADKSITVGSVDDKNTVNRTDDKIAESSNRGPRKDDGDDNPYDELKPDIVVPGVNIVAARYNTEDEYREVSGTSFAAPHLAGVVALMLQANPNLKPTLDRNPIQEILRKTAESRGTPDSNLGYEDSDSYYNYSYGWGIVDAYKAVRAAEDWEPPHQNIPPSISITNPKNNAEVSDTITISGTAFDTDGNVTNVELKFDDNDWFNISIISANSLEWNYTWNTKNVENGKHTISVKCYDGETYSAVQSIDVNVYNEVSAGGVEEKTKINPIYLVSAAGIIGAVVIVVVCVLLFRRKKPSMKPGFPAVPPPPATGVPSPVTVPPPPITGIPSVTAQCPNCGNIIQITSAKRPLKVKCPKCGAGSILR
ncbi:MAG: S8 family serine peptidase [Thermoplasmatales archaeon]|nr:S8 family serine peptidase [Thermoplasmatales archaeon]